MCALVPPRAARTGIAQCVEHGSAVLHHNHSVYVVQIRQATMNPTHSQLRPTQLRVRPSHLKLITTERAHPSLPGKIRVIAPMDLEPLLPALVEGLRETVNGGARVLDLKGRR